MLSLFCVLVWVVAQPTLSIVQATATPVRKIYFNGFISRNLIVDNNVFNRCSESNPSGDLRAVHNGVEKEAVVLVVNGEGPVTDLSKDVTGEVDTDYPFDLPH